MKHRAAITRRAVLRGAGAAVVLPAFESLRQLRAAENGVETAPARMVCVYTPHGVRNSAWYPEEAGTDYVLSPTLRALEPVREDVSVLTGLCHPRMSSNVGHAAAGRWLTGVQEGDRILVDFASPNKSLSVDQLVAARVGQETRWPSLQLSTEGGAGLPGRSKTLSFNARGLPLPALNRPRAVFDRLFVPASPEDRAAELRRYERRRSLLDNVLEESRELDRKLSRVDREKLAEYLDSVREVEQQLDRNRQWLDQSKPEIDVSELQFEFKDRRGFLKVMYDLMVLALRTDSTRVITMMAGVEVDSYKWSEVGVNQTYHGLQHHSGHAGRLDSLAKVDQLEVELLAGFLGKLRETREGEGTILDNTMVLYGSGMNNGIGLQDGKGAHSTRKLPMLLAGGRKLGIRQGQHLVFENDATPLCNLHVTMLQAMGVEQGRFVDGTGRLAGLT